MPAWALARLRVKRIPPALLEYARNENNSVVWHGLIIICKSIGGRGVIPCLKEIINFGIRDNGYNPNHEAGYNRFAVRTLRKINADVGQRHPLIPITQLLACLASAAAGIFILDFRPARMFWDVFVFAYRTAGFKRLARGLNPDGTIHWLVEVDETQIPADVLTPISTHEKQATELQGLWQQFKQARRAKPFSELFKQGADFLEEGLRHGYRFLGVFFGNVYEWELFQVIDPERFKPIQMALSTM